MISRRLASAWRALPATIVPVVVIYVVAGLLAIVNARLGDDHPRPVELIAGLGVLEVVVGCGITLLPWHRWPRHAPVVLVPFSLALIETFAWAHALDGGTYPIFFVVLFIWVGLALPPRTAMYLAPVTLAAYLTPLWTNAHVGDVRESVGLVVPVCVLVSETVSRFARSARDADRRADALEHEKARAIVERELREQAYESAQRLQALIHQFPATVWTTDTKLRLLWGEGTTPVEVEDGDNLYGVTVGDIYGRDDDSSPVPAHESALRGKTSAFETEFLGVVLRGSVAPRRDSKGKIIGTVGVALDVTEEARARDIARVQAAFLAESPASNIVTDLAGRVTYWSPASEKIFGYSAAEAIGKHIFDLAILPEDADLAQDVFRRISSGGKWSGEWHVRRRDGETVWIWTSLTPLRDDEGAITGILGTAVDVTQRKSLEAQLLQAQRLESVGLLAGGVAHDFNNLLSVIISYSELLLDSLDLEDARREDLLVVLDAGRKGSALTRQLLTFARREVSMPRVLNLNGVVKEMERLLSRTMDGGVDLDLSLGDAPPVRIDPSQLEQVLMNLVVNANDAMPHGGSLRVETGQVVVNDDFGPLPGGLRPGAYARLTVSDSGVGMVAEVRDRIFEPFYTTKRRGGGTGLGLPTVHGIVTKGGGAVVVYSEPGVGTTFNVYLPAAAPTTEEEEALAVRPEVGHGGGELILVAEDEDAVRAVIERVLHGSGYRVLTAASGPDAIEVARLAGEPLELLLTDVVMPKMSGKELSDALKVKTIFMSGYTQQLVAEKGMLEEGHTLIQKPFAAKDLLALVRSMLDAEHETPLRRSAG